jgi:hypothetical protein
MQESGQLNFIDTEGKSPLPNIDFVFVDGHTEKQMLPKFQYKGHTILYAADLLPSVGHIPLPYVMGYDTRPLLTLEEKERILNQAAEENWVILSEHDSTNEGCTLQHTEKGVRLKRTLKINEL